MNEGTKGICMGSQMIAGEQNSSGTDSQVELPPERPNMREGIWAGYPVMTQLRRRIKGAFCRLPDTGLFGLTPLKKHILICGYGRSGSTMLLAMMEYALPKAKGFGREIRAWRAATYAWRNHEVVISKLPGDIFCLHRLRNFYKNRKAELKVIMLVRDPRDQLTSRHVATGPNAYFQDIKTWRILHGYYRMYKNDPDVLVVRYEDMVGDTEGVQRRIEAFTGEKGERPFAEFYKQASKPGFETTPMNGVRPVDKKTVSRWSADEHRARLEKVLQEVPDLPEILIELGYEKDDAWLDRWRQQGVVLQKAG